MGKLTTGEKPKFDLITASKTKKYKIISAVVLVIGILLLGTSILLRSMLSSAVTPNALTIMDKSLSGLEGKGPINYTCTISKDESFVLTTGTPQDRGLANPITFELDDNAKNFLEVRDKDNKTKINRADYQGMFWLHILKNAPDTTDLSDADLPSGYLTIRCGSKTLRINFKYRSK